MSLMKTRVEGLKITDKQGVLQKLMEWTIIRDSHWIYCRTRKEEGYGRLKIEGKSYNVNRLSLYIHSDLDINNSEEQALHNIECNLKTCWNPSHLHKGNNSTNRQDYSELVQATPNFPCGHPRIESNIYISKNKKQCKQCKLDYDRLKKHRPYKGNTGPRNR